MKHQSQSHIGLLDLDGFIAEMGGGYWIKIEAKEIGKTESKPHGIDYSLTLHEANGARFMGYDNAHPVRSKKGPGGRRRQNDHKHHGKSHRPYHYESAQKLLEDFWADVDTILTQKGVI
jgi:hypothetical protein